MIGVGIYGWSTYCWSIMIIQGLEHEKNLRWGGSTMNFWCYGSVNCYPDDKNILKLHCQYDQVIDITGVTNSIQDSSGILRQSSSGYID